MREKHYVVTGGDSFSYETTKVQKHVTTPIDLINTTNMSYFHHMEVDFTRNGINSKFYNLGWPSAGNHYILYTVKQKVDELIDEGINPNNIWCFVQCTYFMRNLESLDATKMNTDLFKTDYYDMMEIYSDEQLISIVMKNLNEIENTAKYFESLNINFKFFFHQDCFSLKESGLSKNSLTKFFSINKKINDIKKYFVYTNEENLTGAYENYLNKDSDNIWSVYLSKIDLHFTTIVWYYWYVDKIKPIVLPYTHYFIDEEILLNKRNNLKEKFLTNLEK